MKCAIEMDTILLFFDTVLNWILQYIASNQYFFKQVKDARIRLSKRGKTHICSKFIKCLSLFYVIVNVSCIMKRECDWMFKRFDEFWVSTFENTLLSKHSFLGLTGRKRRRRPGAARLGWACGRGWGARRASRANGSRSQTDPSSSPRSGTWGSSRAPRGSAHSTRAATGPTTHPASSARSPPATVTTSSLKIYTEHLNRCSDVQFYSTSTDQSSKRELRAFL